MRCCSYRRRLHCRIHNPLDGFQCCSMTQVMRHIHQEGFGRLDPMIAHALAWPASFLWSDRHQQVNYSISFRHIKVDQSSRSMQSSLGEWVSKDGWCSAWFRNVLSFSRYLCHVPCSFFSNHKWYLFIIDFRVPYLFCYINMIER